MNQACSVVAWSSDIGCGDFSTKNFTDIVDAPTQLQTAIMARDGDGGPYCQINGRVGNTLDAELRLPAENWNGRFVAVANVLDGERCDEYVRRGYACMPMFRHFKRGQKDTEWAQSMKDPGARVQFNTAPHVLTLAGKALTTRYYGKSPTKSYFLGCSAGGNTGLTEAQLFPDDYDGIVVGAPNLDTGKWLVRAAWHSQVAFNADGAPILQPKDIELLHRSATAACDRDDGLQDGIIGNALGCRFSPRALACSARPDGQCLSEPQIQAAEKIYAGPNLRTPNMFVGSELRWPLQDRSKLLERYTPYFQSIFFGATPELTPASFDFKRDMERIGLGYSIPKVDNPDLRSFKEAGGKLIAYLGANDNAFVTDVVDYYEVTERTMGGRIPTQDFFRLFLVPGMNHCRGGVGPFAIDYLSYIETWVEHDKAPDALIGQHVTGVSEFVQFPLSAKATTVFARPVFPYPMYAKYKGTGNPKRAENFYAVDPTAGPVLSGR